MNARSRQIPLRYDDGFRGTIAMLISTALAALTYIVSFLTNRDGDLLALRLVALCIMFTSFSLIYLVWTHVVFARGSDAAVTKIAEQQHRLGPSRASRALGFAQPEQWALTAATSALVVSIAATVVGARQSGLWLTLLVLITAASAWATMVYACALRYFRLHAGGERIEFDIDETPIFIDFVSMSVMVSAVGALSAGTPRTRAALGAVRTHTYISFAFNALVVAMTVSLVSSLVATL